MKKFLKDFKEFALKGNVIDMAVGVVIGGAFGKIVTSLVNDIINPVIGAITGGINTKYTARFDTHEELAAMLRRMAKSGDTLLFKGSRGMKMEKVLALFLGTSEGHL